MTDRIYPNPARPSKFEDRYRLYLDESGDHVFREIEELIPTPANRLLLALVKLLEKGGPHLTP